MLTMIKYGGAVFFVGLFLGSQSALADDNLVININFGVKAPSAQLEGDGPQTWNILYEASTVSFPVAGSLANLKDSSGGSTNVDFTWGSNVNYTTTSRTAFRKTVYENLMKSYAYTQTGKSANMAFSSLDEGSYTLYVYSQSEIDNQVLAMTASSGGMSTTESTYTSVKTLKTLSEQQNYLKFEDILVGSDGIISLSFNGVGSDGIGVVNGFQLVKSADDLFGAGDNDVSAVPEPNTVLLLGVGGVLMAFGSWHRNMNLDTTAS